MRLAVVIVNYNVKHYLAQCLHSLYKSLDGVKSEVYVVDNASSDGSKEYIERMFPQTAYIYNNVNVGFAGACNQAMRLTSAEYILLLNPDTILPESNIAEMLDFMDAHPDAGACGVKMLAPDGHFLPESKRGYPSLMATFCKLTSLYKLFPKSKSMGGYYMSHLDNNNTNAVDVLAGAYMMLRADALSKSGLLDEDFFMYGEDIELSCRITDSGYKNYYLPIRILHYKGESTKRLSVSYVKSFYGAMGIFYKKRSAGHGAFSRMAVLSAIKMLTYAKLLMAWIGRHCSSEKGETDKPKRFLVFADERHVEYIKTILRRNSVEQGSHYVVAGERSAAAGHSVSERYGAGFTHVMYDSTTFSYEHMLQLLEENAACGMELAVYQRQMNVVITSDNIYK